MSFLMLFTVIIFLIAFISIINEKVLHIANDIAILIFAFVIGLIGFILQKTVFEGQEIGILQQFANFEFESYLLDGVLCFMLFAGASEVSFSKFVQNAKSISLLAICTTTLSTAFYGILFFAAARIFELPVDFWICLLLGCIVSPTDPIAATGILNKLGLSKSVTVVIEGESLYNDGIGVVLFAFIRSIVTNLGKENPLVMMGKEVLGAAAVSLVITFLMFQLLKLARKPIEHILISLATVSMIYMLCEWLGFSGVIASVVCGMYFAWLMEKYKRTRGVIDPENIYRNFWSVLDETLNGALFILIGIMTVGLSISKYFVVLIPVAVLAIIISRGAGIGVSSLLIGKKSIPSGYSFGEFVVLMTWSALKGGLSLALVISTRDFLDPAVYDILLNVTYITILFTVIVQGLTTPGMYRSVEKHKAGRIHQN